MKRWAYAVIGMLAAAFGVATGTLVAALIGPAYAPIEVVASTAIDIPPAVVKEWATSTFGTATKSIVVALVIITVLAVSAWAGIRSRDRVGFGVQVMIIAGVVGAAAALLRPVDALLAPLPSLAAGAAAALALWVMMRLARADAASTGDGPVSSVSRRHVLIGAGSVVVLGGIALASARWITNQASATASRLAAVLPRPAEPLQAQLVGVPNEDRTIGEQSIRCGAVVDDDVVVWLVPGPCVRHPGGARPLSSRRTR